MSEMPGKGIKTGNYVKDWWIDRIADSTKVNERGDYEAGGLMGLLGGATGIDVGLIEDREGKRVEHRAAQDLMRANGLTNDDIGIEGEQWLTTSQVASGKRKKDKADLKVAKKEQRDNEVADRNAGYTQQTNVAQMGLDARAADNLANRQQQSDQFAHTSRENSLNRQHDMERADKRDSLSLQMQVMQNDLAEKRMDYDRETRRMDKRSAAIAQLMSGLGSLGGAFIL